MLDGESRQLHRGDSGLSADARDATRTKAGQPEGFLEAFANIYRDVAGWIPDPGRGAPPRALAGRQRA